MDVRGAKIEMKDLEYILKDVEKPGRYIGGEWNQIKKDPDRVKMKVALVFPDLYEVGMSYLGQKILYSLLNAHPDILAERVFAPWIDFERKLRKEKIPLYSLENKIPLKEFNILGFSLLYELNFSNILTILDLGQIPVFSSERDSTFPLIIAGGPAAFNPEPIAEFFDFFLMGDGEEAFIEIIEKYRELKIENLDKSEIFKEMSKIRGVYVPALYTSFQPHNSPLLTVKPEKGAPKRIEKRVLFPFHEAPFPEKIVVPNIKVVFDRVSVEVARGCDQKCRFCQAMSVYSPPRVKRPSYILKNIMNNLKQTGYENVSLASLSIADYPYLDQTVEALMAELAKNKISLSLPSLRPKGLSGNVAANILKVRKTGFTLVPEAGTERLRRVINKSLGNREILEAARNAFLRGWRLLKLYFMIGLPTEKEEDLEGIVRMVEEVTQIGYRALCSAPRINLSIASFIPKPHTPFQWLAMEDEIELREKYRLLGDYLKKYPFVKLKRHHIKSSLLEAAYSRGDRKLNKVLHRSWQAGARFDSWADLFSFRLWEESFEDEQVDYHAYLSPLERKARLPWDHIETGMKRSHLLEELDKALKGEATGSCQERNCTECHGCTFFSLLERGFSEKIRIPHVSDSLLGKKTEEVFRYRVFYSKIKLARFLSHIDLNNIIQRTLRRAGISVNFSQGFHPKMLITYPPALPLGMEGDNECFEFLSQHLLRESEFKDRVNAFLPEGIRINGLMKMENLKPSLNEEIESLIYSLDLENKDVREAVKTAVHKKKLSLSEYFQIVQIMVEKVLSETKNEKIKEFDVDRRKKRLILHLKHSPEKNISAVKIVEKVLQMRNSAFAMTRDKILFKNS